MRFYTCAVAFLFAIASVNAYAKAGDPVDLQIRSGHYYTTITLDKDGRATEVYEWSRIILKKSAIESSKEASISFSTSAQTGEVLTAYTQKADGRRIEVPKDNYQIVINRGQGGDSPVYSDRTSLTVVFPDIEVGDTEVFSYKLVEKEPLFPGEFSDTASFSSAVAYDDVRVSIDYPVSLSPQYESNGMVQSVRDGAEGRKIVEWKYSNPNPVEGDRRNWTVYDADKEVHFAFSTFASYEEISGAYGLRAKPKAAVSDRVRKLSDEIVNKAISPRDQAKALYEWVATNIDYAGNCIGIGAVVPRDLSFVLDNKIGDCKDHATLLQALLAARGILSTQALINAGSVYRLPKVPVVSTVNHVINYIPSLNLFVDSTSQFTPFGQLPNGDRGKPVLLVDGFRSDSRTPVSAPDANREVARNNLVLSEDGTLTGSTEVFENGDGAASMRAWARQLSRNDEQNLVRDMLRQLDKSGSGTFTKDDPTALSDSYRYQMEYKIDKFIRLPGAGAFYIASPLGSFNAIQNQLQFTSEPEKDFDVFCESSTGEDEYVLKLPNSLKILSIPENVRLENQYLRYEATYRLKKNELVVKRVLINKTMGSVCSPAVAEAYRSIEAEVADDLRSQVLYKQTKRKSTAKDLH